MPITEVKNSLHRSCQFFFCALLYSLCLLSASSGSAQNLNYGYVPSLGSSKNQFTFAIWGDPQVAYYEPGTNLGGPENKRIQEEVVPRLQRSVELTNRLAPEFVVTLGDNVHNTGEWENFKVFVDCVRPLQMPLYLLMGNHDHVPAADSLATNPLRNVEFANFIWAQKQINGLDRVVYSFDAGDWHFVLFSEPGLTGYGVDSYLAAHPEYLSWLAADLQANQNRPTIFFTHHPLLPVGNAKFDLYGPGPAQREQLADILTRYGNVKFAFFGHVHNTVASIPLISWRYKGTAFIVIPNSAITARRGDYLETTTSSYGVALVTLNQQACEAITFHTLAGEKIAIDPGTLPEYDDTFCGYLKPEYDLPAENYLRNGDFEMPSAEGWFGNQLLPYNEPPLARRSIISSDAASGTHALQFYTKALLDSENTTSYMIAALRQAVTFPAAEQWPVLRLKYKMSSREYHHPEAANAFVEINGYKRGERIRVFGLGYGLGRTYMQPGVRGAYVSLKIAPVLDQWQDLIIYPRSDYESYFPHKKWQDLEVDRLVITLGVYNENFTPGFSTNTEMGVTYDAVEWSTVKTPTPSTAGISEVRRDQPREFDLYQNYPNPFNPATEIKIFLEQASEVSLAVYDLRGAKVADLLQGRLSAGQQRVKWRPEPAVTSGVYVAVLRVQGEMRTIKMLVLR